MEKTKDDASSISKLKELKKHNEIIEANIEKRAWELEAKEKEVKRLSLDLEKRSDFFRKEVADCNEELRLKRNELFATTSSLTMYQREVEMREHQLRQVTDELNRRYCEVRGVEGEIWRKREEVGLIRGQIEGEMYRKREEMGFILSQIDGETCRKKNELGLVLQQIEGKKKELGLVHEEIEGKKKELGLVLDQIKESGKQLEFLMVDEKLESRQTLLGIRSSELASKEKELESVRESIKLSKSDLDLKEKKVESLNNCITVCVQEIDSKTKELGEIQKMIEQRTSELDLTKPLIRELSKELATKEKRHTEIVETIRRSSCEMKEKAKEIEVAEAEASGLYARSQRFRKDVEEKEKELGLLKNQIESEEKKLIQLKREVEEETDGKKKDLELILSKIDESGAQLVVVDEKLESQRRLLEIRSVELVSEDMELECVRESSKLAKYDLEGKEKRVQALNDLLKISGEQLDLKSKELEKVQKLIEQQTSVLDVMNNHLDLLKNKIETKKKILIQVKREMEAETDRKKKDLVLVLSKLEESRKQLASVDKQQESQQRQLEIQSRALVRKENELGCVGESSKRLLFDLEVKQKRVQELKNLIKISDEQLELKSKELGEVQNLIEEERKRLCEMQNQQPSIQSEQEPVCEDSLMHHESSASLARDEVSKALKASPDPTELVLDLVQEYIREGSSLEEDIMVLFFDELAKRQLPNQPQLQLKAREVATLWKGKITIEAPKSSLEALAFLLFIVAYELKELINQEESTLLASSIAHYEQAPRLFKSLGLTLMIPELVKELINKRQFIPAVRFMCLFKLNSESSLSPSELLKEEIIKLRQSALGKRQNESSQTKDKDAGRLRAILELVADYDLEVVLPGDLVAKLIVQRDKSTPLICCSVIELPSLSNNQATNSPNSVSGQRSSVNLLRVPKPEFKNLKRPRF